MVVHVFAVRVVMMVMVRRLHLQIESTDAAALRALNRELKRIVEFEGPHGRVDLAQLGRRIVVQVEQGGEEHVTGDAAELVDVKVPLRVA